MSLLALISLPFLAVALLMAMRQASRGVHMLIAAIGNAGSLAILLSQANAVLSGRIPRATISWLPTLGLAVRSCVEW